jgi:hypothetical protein
MKATARKLKKALARLLSPFSRPKRQKNDAAMTANEWAARFKVYKISDFTPKKKSGH